MAFPFVIEQAFSFWELLWRIGDAKVSLQENQERQLLISFSMYKYIRILVAVYVDVYVRIVIHVQLMSSKGSDNFKDGIVIWSRYALWLYVRLQASM